MNKVEGYILTNKVLKENKEYLKKYHFNLYYDIISSCKKYGIDKIKDTIPAYFDPSSKSSGILKVDFDYLYKNKDKNVLVDDEDIKFLMVVYHELAHAYQYVYYTKYEEILKNFKDKNFLKMNYLMEDLFFEYLIYFNFLYNDYHHYYPVEHQANVSGIVNSINKINIDDVETLKRYLTLCYDKTYKSFYSPFEILKNKISTDDKEMKKELEKIDNLSPYLTLYDRLSYGLNVSEDEFDYVMKSNDTSDELIRKIKR